MKYCEQMDTIVEDESFALFLIAAGRNVCNSYEKCEVVKTPVVFATTVGAGWMFPKRSPFLPILKIYFGLVQEAGSYNRVLDYYNEKKLLPEQECLKYDGDPIQMRKAVSLIGIILGGTGLSFIIFL